MRIKSTYLSFLVLLALSLAVPAIGFGQDLEEMKEKAEELFDEAKYNEALSMYSTLLSNDPESAEYNFRFGACVLHTESNKEECLRYLEFAVEQTDVDPLSQYFLGKAYHLNYQFNEAIEAYGKFKAGANSKQLERYDVNRRIEMATNGKDLLRDISDLTVLERKELTSSEFFRAYDLTNMSGKLLAKPEEFQTPDDKKKGDNTVMFLPKNSDLIYYTALSEKGKTGLDIYFKYKKPNGEFSEGEPLGPPINTPYDDAYPFLHPDEKTLYFSSKGHNSMGGYDVFVSEKTANGAWGAPKNIDFAISTPDDDFLYITDEDKKQAYFASTRESDYGKTAVYKVNVARVPLNLIAIKGTFVAGESKTATITINELGTSQEYGVYTTNPGDGSYLLRLPKGKKYQFLVKVEDANTVHAGEVEIKADLDMVAVKQEMSIQEQSGKEILVIKNLFDQEAELDEALVTADILKRKAKLSVTPESEIPKSTGPTLTVEEGAPIADVDATSDGGDTDKSGEETEGATLPAGTDAIIADARKEAAEIEQEAAGLREQSNQAYAIAMDKKDEAGRKKLEYDQLITQANNATDEEKTAVTQKAVETRKGYISSAKQASAAVSVAKELDAGATRKEQEAQKANQYADDIEKALNEGSAEESVAKLEELQKMLEADDELESPVAGLEAENSKNKAAYEQKLDEVAVVERDLGELKTDITKYESLVENTKKKKDKELLQSQLTNMQGELPLLEEKQAKLNAELEPIEKEYQESKAELDFAQQLADGTLQPSSPTELSSAEKASITTDVAAIDPDAIGIAADSEVASSESTGADGGSIDDKFSDQATVSDESYNEFNTQLAALGESDEDKKQRVEIYGQYNEAIKRDVARKETELAAVSDETKKAQLESEIEELNSELVAVQQNKMVATAQLPIESGAASDQAFETQRESIEFDLKQLESQPQSSNKTAAVEILNSAYVKTLDDEISQLQSDIVSSQSQPEIDQKTAKISSLETQKQEFVTAAGSASLVSNGSATSDNETVISVGGATEEGIASTDFPQQEAAKQEYVSSLQNAETIEDEEQRWQTIVAVQNERKAELNDEITQLDQLMAAASEEQKQSLSQRKTQLTTEQTAIDESIAAGAENYELVADATAAELTNGPSTPTAGNAIQTVEVPSKQDDYQGYYEALLTNLQAENQTPTVASKKQEAELTKEYVAAIEAEKNGKQATLDQTEDPTEQAKLIQEINGLKSQASQYRVQADNAEVLSEQLASESSNIDGTANNIENDIANNTGNKTPDGNTIDGESNAPNDNASGLTADAPNTSGASDGATRLDGSIAQTSGDATPTNGNQSGTDAGAETNSDNLTNVNSKSATELVPVSPAMRKVAESTAVSENERVTPTSEVAQAEIVEQKAEVEQQRLELDNQLDDAKEIKKKKLREPAVAELEEQQFELSMKENFIAYQNDGQPLVAETEAHTVAPATYNSEPLSVVQRKEAQELQSTSNARLADAEIKMEEARAIKKKKKRRKAIEEATPELQLAKRDKNQADAAMELANTMEEAEKKALVNAGFKAPVAPVALASAEPLDDEAKTQMVYLPAYTIYYEKTAEVVVAKKEATAISGESEKLKELATRQSEQALELASKADAMPEGEERTQLLTQGTALSKAADENLDLAYKLQIASINKEIEVTEKENELTTLVNGYVGDTNAPLLAIENERRNGAIEFGALLPAGSAASALPDGEGLAEIEPTESSYGENNPIPLDRPIPNGVVYKVQVGAFRNPIPQDLFKGFAPIGGERIGDGLTRYTAGLFKQFNPAIAARDKIRGFGYEDAFVVAYRDGKRIGVSAARQESGDGVASTTGSLATATPAGDAPVLPSQAGTSAGVGNENPEENNIGEKGKIYKSNEIQGLFYTVQVGAYSKPVNAEDLYDLTPLNEDEQSGIYRYTSGIYTNTNAAEAARNTIVQKGISDAFVVAYYNGQKTTMANAAKLANEQGVSVFANAANLSGGATTEGNSVQNGNFAVEFGRYTGTVPNDEAAMLFKFQSEGVKVNQEGGADVYLVGNFTNRADAENLLGQIKRAGQAGAKIVSR